jgi:hypothetical protein
MNGGSDRFSARKKMDVITEFWKIFLDAAVFGDILPAIIR